MRRATLLAATGLLFITIAAIAQPAADADGKESKPPAERLALADKVRNSFVVVEYALQYDSNGEPPPAGEHFMRDERPLEYEGWVLAADEVITRDLHLHPRFIRQIQVRAGKQLVSASVVGYYPQDNAVLLKLAEPLKDAPPLQFKPEAKAPYYFADYSEIGGRWTIMVMPLEMGRVAEDETGRKFASSSAIYSLAVDGNGDAVGLRMHGEFPLDESWKGSPKDWPIVAEADMVKKLDRLGAIADFALLRVKLHFRSPRKDQERHSDSPTEQTVAGLLLAPDRLMVLANLDPKITARLERIVIHPISGEPIQATFAGTLSDYGCFIATLDQPLRATNSQAGPVKLAQADIESFRNRLLLSVELRLQGDQRIAYYLRDRLTRFSRGWLRRVYPDVRNDSFLFDPDSCELICLPLARREKVAIRERYSYRGGREMMMPAGYVSAALADGAKAYDPANVPLTEEEENRLAWLGVELQALDEELARANKISDLTRNGSFGALVSLVYPDSPAAKAGVEAGWVIVRMHAPDQPKPIEVRLERYGMYWERFPWDKWDELPEQYFEQVPRPWPPVETSLIRALTDLGFGKKVQIEFYVPGEGDAPGKLVTKDFVIEQSPAHFDTAPRHTAKDIGLTVRDMTYEVSRYFRKKPEDPGVIISRIEPGSKASVAGVKPFEVVTAVNDKPVMDVKEFEKLLGQAEGELRLNIKRMARGRLVKIDLAAAVTPAVKTEPEQ